VSGDGDEIVNNIWFVEWKKDQIDPDFKPPSDKTIDLGNGKTIRVNYLLVNTFERIYDSLNQNSSTSMEYLMDLQSTIYNIIKSKSIRDLEVDMLTMHAVSDENQLAKQIGFKLVDETTQITDEKVALLGVATVADTEQILARFPMRISQVAEKVGFSYWYKVDQLIKRLTRETGFNIKESNNRYHINFGIKQAEHRYSNEAVALFQRLLNNEDYYIIGENEERIHPLKNNPSQ
jgi:hypothetical protein